MKPRRVLVNVSYGLIFIGLLIVCFAVFSSLWWGYGPYQPNDFLLEWQFNRQKTNLERLVSMMNEDRQMTRIAYDFTWKRDNAGWPRPESEWGISKQRWDDYRRLFSQAGVKNGTVRAENSSDVQLIVWDWGLSVGGTSIGFLYCGPTNK